MLVSFVNKLVNPIIKHTKLKHYLKMKLK